MQAYHDDLADPSILIPIKIVNGRPEFFYGDAFPKLREGAVGDLVLSRSALLDQQLLARLDYVQTVPVLRKGTIVRVAINPKHPEDGADGVTIRRSEDTVIDDSRHTHWVEVELEGDLALRMRGTKKATLRPVECLLPFLKIHKPTLNQAYAAVAQHYEPNRQSSTGNVFKKCYYLSGDDGKWWPIERLRGAAEAVLEAKLFRPQMDLPLGGTLSRSFIGYPPGSESSP